MATGVLRRLALDGFPADIPKFSGGIVANVDEAIHERVAAKDVKVADAANARRKLRHFVIANLIVRIAHAGLLDIGDDRLVPDEVIEGTRRIRACDHILETIRTKMSVVDRIFLFFHLFSPNFRLLNLSKYLFILSKKKRAETPWGISDYRIIPHRFERGQYTHEPGPSIWMRGTPPQ